MNFPSLTHTNKLPTRSNRVVYFQDYLFTHYFCFKTNTKDSVFLIYFYSTVRNISLEFNPLLVIKDIFSHNSKISALFELWRK